METPATAAGTPATTASAAQNDTLLSIIEARLKADYEAALTALESRVKTFEAESKAIVASDLGTLHTVFMGLESRTTALEAKAKSLEEYLLAKAKAEVTTAEGDVTGGVTALESKVSHIGVDVRRFF